MAKKSMNDHVIDILEERGELHASQVKDLLFDKVKGATPSIRELVSLMKRDQRVASNYAPAGVTQIKTWRLKKP